MNVFRGVLVAIVVIVYGCKPKISFESERIDEAIDVRKIENLKGLLGSSIGELKKLRYTPGIALVDTIFESEGVEWPGLRFNLNKKQILFIETSWKDKRIVSRITVVSDRIRGNNEIVVGSRFIDIKGKLSPRIPSYPDGYFGLRDLDDEGITYFFELKETSNEPLSFDLIPSDLKVTEILIEKR